MRFSLFLLVAIFFSFDANAAADIVNRNCNPEMTACMADVKRKFGLRINPDREVAQAQCLARFNECTAANGGITQKSGRIAQMYNPANADFIECRKTISDPNSDAFTACMRGRVQSTPKKTEKAELNVIPQPKIVIGSCSKQYPEKCTTELTCAYNNGQWDGKTCTAAACPEGSVANNISPERCTCLSDISLSIERGSQQQCPGTCRFEDHKIYDGPTKSCACADGYRDPSGSTNNVMVCIAVTTPTPPSETADECLREIQEKVNSCNSAATTAVNQCNPDRENDDTITSLQNLLKGATGVMGASEKCAQAAIAGSTGYYALDELRGKCDTEIGSCKTSCADATSYINANKDRVYQACRKKQYDFLSCRFDNPFPTAFTEPEWNAEWDKVNKAPFEQKIQEMQSSVASNNTKCESGTAVTNREKVSSYMTDMDSTFKAASQCECQLNSGGANCANLVGPKDCAADPTLAGCASAQVNCLNAADTSPKCVCFRDPNSNECKNIAANPTVNTNSNLNGFAGPGGVTPTNGIGETSVGGKAGIDLSGDDLRNLGSSEVSAMNSSGTATADGGSPFGVAGAAGGPGVGGNFGSGENASQGEEDSSLNSKIGGMFNAAKGAIGNLFGDKKGSGSEATKSGAFGSGLDANGNSVDTKKWRPGKMVRGLASGADTELAGKFEDIWRVMNKRYKVQDQKDLFIFGEKN